MASGENILYNGIALIIPNLSMITDVCPVLLQEQDIKAALKYCKFTKKFSLMTSFREARLFKYNVSNHYLQAYTQEDLHKNTIHQ